MTGTRHMRQTVAVADGTKLRSPRPAFFRSLLRDGDRVREGELIGVLDVLGNLIELRVPHGVDGTAQMLVTSGAAVDARTNLLEVHALETAARAAKATEASASASSAGPTLRAPTAGRFYSRPGPGKPAFVSVGQRAKRGQTVALLEVMKTFHRVTFDGPSVPDEGTITRIIPAEEADVNMGDALIEYAP